LPIRAFLLVFAAATAHATWNLLAKQFAGTKYLIWLASAMEALIFAPLVIWIIIRQGMPFSASVLLALVATGVLHVLYTDCLIRGYRIGDFTVVYPLARGSAPLLSFVAAVVLLREHTSLVAVSGALLISVGILLASGTASGLRGIATGITIACYTIVDAYSVTRLMIAPLIVEYAEGLFRTVFFSRKTWLRRADVRDELTQCWKGALGIALLMPIAYVMTLSAMKLAPISRVAPVREMSMMIGTFFGAKFLQEGHLMRRGLGSAFIVCGVAAIALG
jgi:uncharacterized membrane protein